MRKLCKRILLMAVISALLAGCGQDETLAGQTTSVPETEPPAVTISGGAEPLVLQWNTEIVELTHPDQSDSLAAQAGCLPELEEIRFGDRIPQAKHVLALREAFPNARLQYAQVELQGHSYDRDTRQIDLSKWTAQQLQALIPELAVLDKLEEVNFIKPDGTCTVSLEDASALHEAYPGVHCRYCVELFGQVLSTDMEQVEYFRTEIGDAGLEQFRKLLPMMDRLTYFKLDWCGTGNEAMAQLRDDFADQCKVVWRVFMGKYNCLTDTYKIWANELTTEEADALKYCTEVKYMDIGHSRKLENIDFTANMPDLEVLVIADCSMLSSIEPLRSCKKLEYLEVFSTNVSDLSPLAELTELEHLNISNMPVEDLSPLNNLSKMKRLWSNRNDSIEDQVLAFQARYPECEILTQGGHPVNYQWRFTSSTKKNKVPRYALLKKQIGYETADKSCYPRGYVREEITYESTGIQP